jgi:hypothetical protein
MVKNEIKIRKFSNAVKRKFRKQKLIKLECLKTEIQKFAPLVQQKIVLQLPAQNQKRIPLLIQPTSEV